MPPINLITIVLYLIKNSCLKKYAVFGTAYFLLYYSQYSSGITSAGVSAKYTSR